MSTTVEAIYKEGAVELLETPMGIPDGRVLLTFQPAEEKPKRESVMLPYGKYKGDNESTEEDFKLAEWHGEDKFEDI